MTCHQARQQLAAYRRDDWTAAEMRTLADHLAGCAECRQAEAVYRRVGESLRLLPTIAPDAAFRERVFAAIAAADQHKLGPAAIRASRAQTEPSLPVVRAPVTPIHRRRPPISRAAIAIAAVLALSLFASQFVPSLASGALAASFFRAFSPISAPRATPTLTSGVFTPSGQLPFSSGQFHATSAYRGWVGSHWVFVYAGESWINAATQQGSGALRIYDSQRNLLGVFITPSPTRWLEISGAHGETLSLRSDSGAVFSFNLVTDSFTA